MKKYLIIGGAGFVGSHLSRALLDFGNKVVILDKRDGVDVEDTKKIASIFKKEKPDFVIHLAGPINLRKPSVDPLFARDINFLSRTKIILEACKKNNVKKILFVSSGGAIYQDAKAIPTSETYLSHPTSLYGLANLAIEKYIQDYSAHHGLDFSIARLSNVYGSGQWQSGFVPATILKILKKERPVINGTGLQTRDFIYIDDVVKALMMLVKMGGNTIYNVASGKEVSLQNVFLLIVTALGAKVKPEYKKITVLETQRSALDIKKIKKELDWQPKTDVKTGIIKTIEWYGKEISSQLDRELKVRR